ncbi:MAG: nucleotidyl transferase AbiEii/AbiGii toxin family protein [Nitrososphaerales archaeon]
MYDVNLTEPSKGALVEVASSLEMYKEDFALVGGWAPFFLTRKFFSHCGSIDIDLVLKPKIMPKYSSIREIVLSLGYEETKNPFRYSRTLKTADGKQAFKMELDFLTEPEAALSTQNLIEVQDDLRACLIQGISIVFDHNYSEIVTGILPGDGESSVSLKVADIMGSLVTKGRALPRLKAKDCYDIYALSGFFNGSPDKAALAFRESVKSSGKGQLKPNMSINDALRNIESAFATPSRFGCVFVSRFTGSDGQIQNDANQRVMTFLKQTTV